MVYTISFQVIVHVSRALGSFMDALCVKDTDTGICRPGEHHCTQGEHSGVCRKNSGVYKIT